MVGRPSAREKSLIAQTCMFLGDLSLGGPKPCMLPSLGAENYSPLAYSQLMGDHIPVLVVKSILYV